MLTVSVAMATFNGAKFIGQQLQSLARQQVFPVELIVTDDGSTDETLDIVSSFAKTAPFKVVIVRNSERLGFRGNFMKAIGLCTGDVIACCDQDDIWAASKIERVGAAFADASDLLVFHGAWLIDAENRRLGPANLLALPGRNSPLSFFPLLGVLGFTMAFRRELTEFDRFWPLSVDHLSPTNRMAHDQWYFFLASVLGDIRYLDDRLVEYRQHGGNTYGVKPWTLLSALAWRLRDHGQVHQDCAFGAASRSELLNTMLREGCFSPEQARTVRRLIDYYQTLSAKLKLRSQIYLAPTLATRVRAFRMLNVTAGYDPDPVWNIGRKAIIKDIVLGLLFRPLMTTPVRLKSIS